MDTVANIQRKVKKVYITSLQDYIALSKQANLPISTSFNRFLIKVFSRTKNLVLYIDRDLVPPGYIKNTTAISYNVFNYSGINVSAWLDYRWLVIAPYQKVSTLASGRPYGLVFELRNRDELTIRADRVHPTYRERPSLLAYRIRRFTKKKWKIKKIQKNGKDFLHFYLDTNQG